MMSAQGIILVEDGLRRVVGLVVVLDSVLAACVSRTLCSGES